MLSRKKAIKVIFAICLSSNILYSYSKEDREEYFDLHTMPIKNFIKKHYPEALENQKQMAIDTEIIRQRELINANQKNQTPSTASSSIFSNSLTMQEFICQTKYPLLISATGLSVYLYLMLKLYNAKNNVIKTNTWASIHKNLPVEALYEIPREKFLAYLEQIIYRTFCDNNPAINYNNLEPFGLFLEAIKQEMKNLEKFINLYWYCKLPVISLFFPNYENELIIAQEKIERLSYMQELIVNKLIQLYS